jgi:hypothetical protein
MDRWRQSGHSGTIGSEYATECATPIIVMPPRDVSSVQKGGRLMIRRCERFVLALLQLHQQWVIGVGINQQLR